MAQIALRQSGTEIEFSRSSPPPPGALGMAAETPVEARVTFQVVDNLVAFQSLEAEWNELFARVARPSQAFQSFAWNWHWCQRYLPRGGHGGTKLAMVIGRADGRLVLILPLVLTRKAGLKQLGWMGEPVSQYGDIVADLEQVSLETMKAAWALAVSATHADLANLRKVRADAVAAPLMAAIGAVITATEEAPYIDLGKFQNYEAFEEALPTKGKKNRRRFMRRLSEQGTVSFETVTGNPEAARLASYGIILKRAWLKLRHQISIAMADDRYPAFFSDAVAGGNQPTGTKVMTIRSRNELAALQIMLENKGARFLHIAVYAAKFEKAGAGGLLLEQAIADCYKDGITHFDFLAPKHEYKMEFADGTVAVNDHAVALSAMGRAYATGFLGVRRRLKAAVEAMPAPIKRGIMQAASLVKRRTE